MPQVDDRRTRRTRSALRRALVELSLERGYANLRVDEISERADVGRATFYAHFRDKQALYDDVVAALLAELKERLTPEVRETGGFTGRPLVALFQHALDNRDAYRVVLRGDGDGRALTRLRDDLSEATLRTFERRVEEQGLEPRLDLRVVARAWVGEQVAVLTWWLEEEAAPIPLEEVAGMLADLSRFGRMWATGVDPTGASSSE
ncbi:TetR/AcrR family transcriptional regulator [Nocardioides insulae]|uniref:TetR/AcrR family transcriptional regulator n=1 Tax=Nocardioides insulae TaxID=394734 RepID=UPI0003FF2FB8|nr:TetR/AcrR family transcriptional regulator [Nocardioides insulae]